MMVLRRYGVIIQWNVYNMRSDVTEVDLTVRVPCAVHTETAPGTETEVCRCHGVRGGEGGGSLRGSGAL